MTYFGSCDVAGCSWHFQSANPTLITEFFGNHFAKAHAGLTGGLHMKPVPPQIRLDDPGGRMVDDELVIGWPPENEQLVRMHLRESAEEVDVREGKRLYRISSYSAGLTLAIFLVAVGMVMNGGWAPFIGLPTPGRNIATLIWLSSLAALFTLSAIGVRFVGRLQTPPAYTVLVLAAEIVASTIAVLLAAVLSLAVLGVADMGTPGAGQILPTSFVDLFFLELLLSYASAATLIASTVLFGGRVARLKAGPPRDCQE